MEENFNKLTPAETERLAWLIEECSEVVKAGSKILRHGYYSYDPSDPDHKGNRDDLQREVADVLKAIILMTLTEDISPTFLEEALMPMLESESIKVRYMHHQNGIEGVINV